MREKEKLPPGKRRVFEKAIPDICPFCGQNIDKRSAYSIAHHEFAPHLPYVKSNLHRKRRWQASLAAKSGREPEP
jgi:hypothetical protein